MKLGGGSERVIAETCVDTARWKLIPKGYAKKTLKRSMIIDSR
jgi:hypothetical protein